MDIVILGGGPCGLGAAWRLTEKGHQNWHLFEKSSCWGGLSASHFDDDGFCWDVGGHVLFSHYHYFDSVMDELLDKQDDWVYHNREAWIWMQDRFIPYPLQNNIHHLPKDILFECLTGIIDAHIHGNNVKPAHFGEWIDASFGRGLAKWFLKPYNFKVWGYPVEDLDWTWVGDRVATVDYKRVLENLIYKKDVMSWGPNSKFRFPLHGGTGAIWKSLAERLPVDKAHLNKEVCSISIHDKEIEFHDGTTENYDVLLTTMPLNRLIEISDLKPVNTDISKLTYSSTHIIGLAVKGSIPDHLATKCWMYFPEDNCPFYRTTVFSNYSPNNVPENLKQWSLMCEVCESSKKKVDRNRVIDDVIQGAINTKLIKNRDQIHHTWDHFVEEGYPTPFRNRNDLLFPMLQNLQSYDIYSRGRFGGWRYEVGNMDHSFMQGVEFVDHIIGSETEITFWHPEIVNSSQS